MTDLTHQPAFAAPAYSGFARGPWPALPYLCVFAAGTAGVLLGRAMGGEADAFESKLLLLLRFMAVMKFVGVLAAAGAVHWRLTAPVAPRLAMAYLVALLPMALAPGLIWSLGGIALGALLFHVGFLAFLVLAWKDGGARPRHRLRALTASRQAAS